MQRRPEPELMDAVDQVKAYGGADFSGPNQLFTDLFVQSFGKNFAGPILDLGCGPGDISFRLARLLPACHIHGLDGSAAMLAYARQTEAARQLDSQVSFIHTVLPTDRLPVRHFDATVSNSLLHHLADPLVLWNTAKACTRPGGGLLVMDLLRPTDCQAARNIVMRYANQEPAMLQQDFYNSLLAAYTLNEVREQLNAAGLPQLTVRQVSDRHLAVIGTIA